VLYSIILVTAGAAIIYGAIAAYLYFRQSALIHIPYGQFVAVPSEYGMGYEDVWVETNDGARLHGWHIPHPDSRFTVLYLHGNAGNISYLMDTYQVLHELGVSILTYDYRSYGQSAGALSEPAMYDDAERMFDYLVDHRNIRPEEIIVVGRSLGTAIASWVSATRSPAGLIMESAFTSMAELAGVHYPWLPTSMLLRWNYDSLSRIEKVRCPVLFFHSREDSLTPFSLGQTLFEATRSKKEFIEIHGGHNAGYVESRQIYVDGLRNFINSLNESGG